MNKSIKVIPIVVAVLVMGFLGYMALTKKPISTETPSKNNSQNENQIECGSISQKILTQYDYQPTEAEKESSIKSLTCINQAIIQCVPASLVIGVDGGTIGVIVRGQEKVGCGAGLQKNKGETVICPLPADYIAELQKKFDVKNYDVTIVTKLISDINTEIESGNKTGNCRVIK